MSLAIFTLIIPLFFWNLTANFFTTPKLILLALFALILTGQLIFSLFQTNSLRIPRSPHNLLYFFIIFAVLLNFILIPEGRPEALAGRGGLLLLLPLVSIIISLLPHTKNLWLTGFFVLTSILSLHTLLQLTWLYHAPFVPQIMQSRAFTPTGSFLSTLIILVAGLFASLASLRHASTRLRPLYLIVTFLTTISIVAIISLMLPGSPLALTLLPISATWSVTLDALKSWQSALVGVGLGNYSSFFSSVKPLFLNTTNLWNTLPQSGSSELLTILTTGGLSLFLPLVLLLIAALRHSFSTLAPINVIFITIALGLVIAPANLVLYFLLFLLLPFVLPLHTHELSLPPPIRLIITILILAPLLILLYFLSRPVLADYYSRAGQVALAANDGRAVYEAHLAAVRAYPQLTSSRLAYAETNLRLASALSQKADLTENDRSTIATLIQQSIREGKAATALRPHYSLTWLALGKIYRQLINVATGADQFAVSAYAQAVALDPANPSLRIDFGGLLVQLGTTNLPRARTEFTTAIQLKSDYANAYYNLAKLLESEKDFAGSLVAMKKVATLLPPDSPDQGSIQAAIATLEKQLPAPVATPSALLSAPSPLPSPLPGGPLELNETP